MDNQRSGSLSKHDRGILGLKRLVENTNTGAMQAEGGEIDKVSDDEVPSFKMLLTKTQ